MSLPRGSDRDPAEVGGVLRLEPTRVWRPRTRRPLPSAGTWSLALPDRPADVFDAALRPLLDLVWPRREELARYCQESGAAAWILLRPHAGPDRIVYGFEDPDTLRRVADLNAELHLELQDAELAH